MTGDAEADITSEKEIKSRNSIQHDYFMKARLLQHKWHVQHSRARSISLGSGGSGVGMEGWLIAAVPHQPGAVLSPAPSTQRAVISLQSTAQPRPPRPSTLRSPPGYFRDARTPMAPAAAWNDSIRQRITLPLHPREAYVMLPL